MTDAGFFVSVQQALAWRSTDRNALGARGVFELPRGATAGDVRAALTAVVRRHEILRTTVRDDAGVPLQFIADEAAVVWTAPLNPLADADWLAAPHPAGAALAATWLDEGARLALSIGPLHGDAATLRQIARELNAALAGAPVAVDPVQYADYAQWQREVTEAGDPGFWPARPTMTAQRWPLEHAGRGHFERTVLQLPGSCARSEQEILAAWAWLLSRHIDQPAWTLGVLNLGRNDEVADACGPYARVLPLAVRADGDQPWKAWLVALQADLTAGAEQVELFPGADLPDQFAVLPDRTEGQWVDSPTAYRLRLELTPEVSGFSLRLAADSQRFSAAALQALADQLGALLADPLAPDMRLRDLPLIPAGAMHAAQSGWSDGPAALDARDAARLLPHRISGQARSGGERIAVSCHGQHISYADLDRRASALAEQLVAQGAGPDRIVGVCLPRSVELVVALLGVLKAGAAYLPLDPAYPPDRLAYMLQDSGARWMVVQHDTAALAPAGVSRVVIDAADASPMGLTLPEPQPDHLAYLIYTSGSTGRPKGVAITHRNALHSTLARHRWYEGEVRGYLMLSSVAFDSSVAGIFWTLTQGGELVLPADGDHRDVAALAGLVQARSVSHLLALPSLYAQLLDERAQLVTLTHAIVAGEACPPSLAAAHAAALPNAQLVNEYGPTEVTVWSVAHRVAMDDAPVPIGRPVPFVQAHVLDEALRPLPPGVAGELYLGGPALARGYLGRPELSAERFVPHPFGRGERLYRTGDRVRLRADGQLDFLGRNDEQVKLRGFRIELGEIEARLLDVDGVTGAAAIVREDAPGERRLVAYVGGHPPAPEAMRQRLARSLPEYLLPSVIVVLAELPLTPNGKVDRRVLPAPEQQASRREHVAPRTMTEQLLAAIWCDLLGVESLGVHDDFFERGGHSLLATQVATRVRRSFAIEMPVRELFAAPTVAQLAVVVDARRASGASWVDAPVEPAPRHGALALSFAQQRLWFLAQLEPDDPSYHIAGVLKLSGRVDAAALANAFTALQAHHEVLRSRFVAGRDGRPVLDVADGPLAALQVQEAASDDEARRIGQGDARAPFSLAEGPLLRARLISLSAERHELVLVMHHIVSDGSATERLLQDWAALYAQCLAGEAAALPAPDVQYADYAVWQRAQLTDAVQTEALDHWRGVLGEEQPLLALPTDRPRPPALSGRGGRVQMALPAGLSREARQFAHRHSATLFMLLETAFAALLARSSGQRDIRIGTPASGRDRLELESVVGLFVNTVVLRHEFAPLDGLAALLAQTRAHVLDATQHQHLPFERLVDALAPTRDLSHQPLFQAMFDLQTERYAGLGAFPGLTATLEALDTASSKFDVSLTCADDGEQIHTTFEYSTDLFDHATVERLACQYQALLAQGLAAPRRPWADLPLLAPADAAALCAAPLADLPLHRGFAALFADVAHRHADRVAVSDGSEALSYRQLQQRAETLAAALQAAGAPVDVPVAVLLPRSNDYLVAIVASLLAGCAWLPLDPALPPARLVQMLSQAQPPVLVADPADALTASLLRELHRPPSVVRPRGERAEAGHRWQDAAPHPERLAYVIFTSGSTGVPKGAMVHTAGMLNNLLGKIGQLQLTPQDRIAQTASPCFDISVWQFLTALLCGAQVEIVPDAEAHDAAALLQAVNRRGITVLESVPSLMRGMLADADAPARLPTLRWLLPTGEALPPSLARQWFDRFPQVPLLNAYGPAECADDVALWCLHAAPEDGLAHLPIGRPADNLRLYAVNDALQLQPAGVVAELAIGGVGVGRGYLGDPALTADRFVPDPFGAPGARCYRSGDLVRQAPDGVFTFIGRRDHQVKVRGYRVEPGEVEARLLQHPGVRAAAVLPLGEPTRLVAYVAGEQEIDALALRRFVGEQLPEYMVPSVCMVLRDWPLNTNGKLDRRRLPAPHWRSGHGATAPGMTAMTPVQAALARIWAEVLSVPAVSLHDNFFSLGGDSILVIQVVAKAREAGWKLSAKSLFLHQTVESLAIVAEPVGAVVERPVPVGEVALTPIQHAFFEQHGEQPHHWNQSVMLTPARRLRRESVQTAVMAMAARHDALRLRFSRQDGTWMQRHVEAETAELLEARAVAAGAALADACDTVQASLHIEHGPLWRVGLFDLPDGTQRLLLAAHHLVVDGLSLRTLVDDFAGAYAQAERGETPRLPGRAASFQDWSQELTQRAADGHFDAELGFWQAQTAPPLPVEHPTGRRTEGTAATVQVQLAAEATARLLRCAEWHARPDDFLLAALGWTLIGWSEQPAVLVEMESHGRPDHLDLGGTVGWFTAAYPLRLALSRDTPASDQLKLVKQVLRAVTGSGVGASKPLSSLRQ
jgi:amino acid adenylation domain-containing protein